LGEIDMLKVYVAGPYTKGDVAANVRNALGVADILMKAGCAPFVPHLFHFWHILFPHQYGDWMNLDVEWLKQCDVVLRLPGNSDGADKETELARQLGKHIYTSVDDLIIMLGDDHILKKLWKRRK
jgi:hypothetical protein